MYSVSNPLIREWYLQVAQASATNPPLVQGVLEVLLLHVRRQEPACELLYSLFELIIIDFPAYPLECEVSNQAGESNQLVVNVESVASLREANLSGQRGEYQVLS